MNAISHFNQLKETLQASIVPEIKLAKLDVKPQAQLLSLERVKEVFDQFDPDCGWVLYRDALSSSMVDFSRTDIIEGEWCKQNASLRMRLVSPNQYQVTESHLVEGNTEGYQDIKIRLQPVSGRTHAQYRIWWRCERSGPRQGRWEPYYQQFIGFDLGE